MRLIQDVPSRITTALAASGIALMSGTALAQDDDAGSQVKSAIDQVIVTTKAGAKNVQTLPVSMTAVTGETLKRTFAQDLRDLSSISPNVSLEPVGIFQNSASFFIRGLGTQDIESAVDPVVAILIDGIYQARVSSALSDMLDVEAVNIMRGPQGTEFGHNSTAGVVDLRHRAPVLNEFQVGGSILAGDFGRLDVKGVVNIPIAEDKAAIRIAMKSTNFDGFWTNDFNGEKRGGHDRITVRPSIRLEPNENLDITIRGEYNRTRDDTYPGQSHNYCRADIFTALALPPPAGGFGPGAANDLLILTEFLFANLVQGKDVFASADQAASLCGKPIKDVTVQEEHTFTNTEERGNFSNLDIWGISAEINYDLPDVGTITYVGNYREVSESIRFQIETSFHDNFAGIRDQEHYQTSHEIRFASDFSETYDFVVGFYYFKQEYTMLQQSFGILFEPSVVLGPSGLPFFQPDPSGQAGWSNQTDRAWAGFVNANWHVSDRLTLTAGVRYTDQQKDFEHCGVGAGDPNAPWESSAAGCNNVPFNVLDPFVAPFNPPGTIIPRLGVMQAFGFDASGGVEGGCQPTVTGDPADGLLFCNNRLSPEPASWSNLSPTVKVSFEVTDDIFAYALWSRGFRSGGFNGRATTPSSIGPYDPERADNYEVGIKTEWLDRRLQINVNGFWMIVDGLQQGFIRPAPDAGGQETVIANIGEVTNKGFELEVTAVPTDGLTLFGSLGFVDTNQKDFCTDGDGFSGTDPTTPPPPPFAFLEQCAPSEQVLDATGNFIGWLVPTDNSNLLPGPRTPKWTLAAGFSYEWLIGNSGSLTLAGDWNYNSKVLISISNASELDGVTQFNGDFLDHFRKAAHVLNASLTWRETEERYRVSFFIKNLTNTIYKQAVTNVAGLFEFRVPNQRRHWGVEVTFDL